MQSNTIIFCVLHLPVNLCGAGSWTNEDSLWAELISVTTWNRSQTPGRLGLRVPFLKQWQWIYCFLHVCCVIAMLVHDNIIRNKCVKLIGFPHGPFSLSFTAFMSQAISLWHGVSYRENAACLKIFETSSQYQREHVDTPPKASCIFDDSTFCRLPEMKCLIRRGEYSFPLYLYRPSRWENIWRQERRLDSGVYFPCVSLQHVILYQ